MSESEIEEYLIDTKEGKSHLILRVSLLDDMVKLLITTPDRPNQKFYNMVRLSQLKEACNAFDKINSIKDALTIIKNNIEEGNIMINEENEDVIDVKFVLKIKDKTYPTFVIGLPNDNEPENNKEENKKDNKTKNNNNKEEVLPVKFDYQGNKEAELKYGQSTKNTTEYIKPIIKSDVKEPNLILEYVEPILQVHYPDGTTKSTALPARLQTADGKEPNIAPEQLKSIRDQITRDFNLSSMDLEKGKNRANSVQGKNISTEPSRHTVQNINNINTSFNNLTPNFKSFQNYNINNSNINNNNDINAVRSAMKPNINMNINMNMNTMNNYNIRQVRTQFNPYDIIDERNTTGSINNNNINMTLSQRNNYTNYGQNNIINKGSSDYGISSLPNKPFVKYNFNNIMPNPTIKNLPNIIINNNNPLIQEIPRFTDKNQNMIINNNNYNNMVLLKRGLKQSSSSPSLPLGNVNKNFYQQNQGQSEYFFGQNNFNNFRIQGQNIQNLQNQINNVNLQMNMNNKINNSHTSFMNYTYNPNLIKNTQNYNFNNIPQNILSRNYSNQNSFSQIRTLNPLNQSSDAIKYQQLMNQRKIQEQQRQQLLQRVKMNNINYNNMNNMKIGMNNVNNINNMNNINFNNVSRNPNINHNQQVSFNNLNNKNTKQGINYAEVNILEQQIPRKNQIRNNENQNLENIQQQMNNLRTRNINLNLNNNINNPSNLKQSQSLQIIRPNPKINNEITEQQIALAQMISKNPNNFNTNIISLKQKFLDSQGNEETQSQFEREANKEPQIRDPNLKIEKEKETENISKGNKNNKISSIPETPKTNSQTNISQTPQEEEDDDGLDPEAEKLFRLENGLIIFRNGLLKGIIHKYKEIDDVVSKIQLKLMAGVKFMLLYRASTDGDKAKIFHEKCDKHNMTLVLVETTKGVRFGGFTTKSWDGKCIKKTDDDAFVFSFDKRKCYDIINNQYAIGGYPKFGPVFFGCQIRIYDDFFTKGGTTCNRGLNYKTKNDYELNNGEQKYIVKEIEVYEIEAIQV